jgi:hypothetical protein
MDSKLYKHIYNYIDFDFKNELVQSSFDNFIIYQVKQETDDYWAEVIVEYDYEDGRLFIEKKYLGNIVNLFGASLDDVVDVIENWFMDYEGVEISYTQL